MMDSLKAQTARQRAQHEAQALRRLDMRAWVQSQSQAHDEFMAAVGAAEAGKSGALAGWESPSGDNLRAKIMVKRED